MLRCHIKALIQKGPNHQVALTLLALFFGTMPMWRTKYASALSKDLRVGVNFLPFSEGDFLFGHLIQGVPHLCAF